MNKQKRAWKRIINRGTMKQAAIILIALGTFITGNPSARADSGNPFGFETNKHPLEYDYCKKEPGLFRDHGYTCSSAPSPHPDLEEYALQFVEEIGLCFIAGVHRLTPFDPRLGNFFPSKLSPNRLIWPNDSFEVFYHQIVKKYGSPTSRKNESDLAGLLMPDIYYWDSGEGFKGLGDVKAIELFYRALPDVDSRAADLKVYFWLVTSDACLKKIDAKADRAF